MKPRSCHVVKQVCIAEVLVMLGGGLFYVSVRLQSRGFFVV